MLQGHLQKDQTSRVHPRFAGKRFKVQHSMGLLNNKYPPPHSHTIWYHTVFFIWGLEGSLLGDENPKP